MTRNGTSETFFCRRRRRNRRVQFVRFHPITESLVFVFACHMYSRTCLRGCYTCRYVVHTNIRCARCGLTLEAFNVMLRRRIIEILCLLCLFAVISRCVAFEFVFVCECVNEHVWLVRLCALVCGNLPTTKGRRRRAYGERERWCTPEMHTSTCYDIRMLCMYVRVCVSESTVGNALRSVPMI